MAILNVEIDGSNLTPVNGKYTFTVQFTETSTGAITTDPRFPQNQTFVLDSVGAQIFLPVEIADGNYSLVGKTVRVLYKSEVLEAPLTEVVECAEDCTGLPIVQITAVSPTTYTVQLTQGDTKEYNWRVLSILNQVIANGHITAAQNTFNIVIPASPAGDYLLELTGTTCRGKAIRNFTVASGISGCQNGPTIQAILTTASDSLKFRFDGLGVFGIAWRIKQGSNVLRNGVVKHTSIAQPGDATFSDAEPTIAFAALPNGNYTFEIEGSTCSSLVDTEPFTITSTEVPLAFVSGSPSVSGTGPYSINIQLTKAGSYNTVILNSVTGEYLQNGTVVYILGTPYVKTNVPVGKYTVQVGTLAPVSLEITAGGTLPCSANGGYGPNLVKIVSVTDVGLSFQFDANNVTAIRWSVKQNGTEVRTGIVYPTNSTPYVTFDTPLPNGNYTLDIRGQSCISDVTPTKPFTVTPQATGNNAGVLTAMINGRYFGYVNCKEFQASITPAGKVHLEYDEILPSSNGQNNTKAYLVNQHMVLVPESEKNALRSAEGLDLPDGNYYFYLYYANPTIAPTWDAVLANIWVLFAGGSGQREGNSRNYQEIMLEIKSNITL